MLKGLAQVKIIKRIGDFISEIPVFLIFDMVVKN